MKIILLARLFYPEKGGIQTYSYELARELSVQGHQVLVLCPAITPPFAGDTDFPFRVVRIPGAQIKWIKTVFYLLAYLGVQLRFRADLTIATIWGPCGLVAYLGRICGAAPYLVVFHGTEIGLWAKRVWARKLLQKTLDKALFGIANSNFTASQIEKITPHKPRLHVIPCGIDLSRFENILPTARESSASLRLLTIAALTPRKGIDKVLEALSLLKSRNLAIRYRVIGKGADLERLQGLATLWGLLDQVEFMGRVEDQEIERNLVQSDVFIMPSRQIGDDFEGFGIVFLEANACGLPVIAGHSGGIPDVVRHEVNGLLVNPNSALEIAQAIESLTHDPNKRKQLGEQGKQHVKAFQWQKIVAQIIAKVQHPI